MLSQVKIYKPNKKTNKLEHHKTISKEEVKILYDSALDKSNSHINISGAGYKIKIKIRKTKQQTQEISRTRKRVT